MSNTQVDDVHAHESGSSLQYYRDELVLSNIGNIIDFLDYNNNNISFNFKQQIAGQTGNNGTRC